MNKYDKSNKKYQLANYLCSLNTLTDEEKKLVMAIAEEHCTGDPHNDHAVLATFCAQATRRSD